MAEQKNTRTIVLALILVIALMGVLAYTFLMGDAPAPEDVPAPVVTGDPTLAVPDPPDAEPDATLPATPDVAAPAPADNPPLTLTALRYLPDQAQIAVGIPSVESLLATVAPFVQEVMKDDLNVEHELGLIARDLARDMGVDESDELAEVLAAIGFDVGLGAAAFFDMEEMIKDAFDAAGEMTESTEQIAGLPDVSTGKVVAVIPVVDGEKAEAALKELTGDMLAGVPTSEETVNDITITVYEGIAAYFVTEAVLAIGNNVDMLKQAAAREGAPATIRYGSATCPPDDVNEAVMLVYGDRLMPFVEQAVGLLAELQPEALFFVQSQLEQMTAMYESGVNDPVIATLSVRDDAIELQSKIDTAVYPALLESSGTPQPLRWAQLLPENTLAFLSLGFTPESKQKIKDVYMEAIPEEMRTSPGFSQGMQIGRTVVDMIGQEVTLGMTELDPIDFPTLLLFVDLENRMSAQVLLPMVPQLPHDDPYRDVQINAINFPSPIQFYFALVEDALVLSNSDDGIRRVIDLVKDEETSGFFESLTPPINPDTPMYQALLIKPELYDSIVAPLSALSGRALPTEADTVFDTLTAMFDDVRFFNEMRDSWNLTRLSVNRKTSD